MNEQTSLLPQRRFSSLLLLLLLIAFGLRAWEPGRISVEHFDEGVYASNYYSSHLDFRYPNQHLYAPPLFPAIIEWVLILTGGNPHSVVWVNVVLGTGLVAAIWWLTKLLAGEGAAIAAAAIATFSDFLIQYSRAVLTDTPVCLFIVLAVSCGLIALREKRSIAAILAALLSAAAWWTKYNGWLALAILGAGLAGWIVFERPTKKEWLPRMGYFLLICFGAFLFWLPCLWGLQQYGGYAAVARNHAGYVVGVNGWWNSMSRQLETQHFYSSLTMFGYLLALASFQFTKNKKIRLWDRKFWFHVFFIIIVCAINEPLLLVFFIGLYAVRRNQDFERVGFWILAAWIVGLWVSTPLYRPYPRLMMLWMTSLVIASGLGIAATFGSAASTTEDPSKFSLVRRLGILGLCLFFTLKAGIGESIYQDRSEFNDISSAIAAEMESSSGTTTQLGDLNAVVYVVGEPGLYYHLASQSSQSFKFIAQPASSLSMLTPKAEAPDLPTFLVVGPHTPQEKIELNQQSDKAEMIQKFSYQASDLVLLDDFPPNQLEAKRQQEIELWKLIRK